jgi:hypothetical protein
LKRTPLATNIHYPWRLSFCEPFLSVHECAFPDWQPGKNTIKVCIKSGQKFGQRSATQLLTGETSQMTFWATKTGSQNHVEENPENTIGIGQKRSVLAYLNQKIVILRISTDITGGWTVRSWRFMSAPSLTMTAPWEICRHLVLAIVRLTIYAEVINIPCEL